MPFRAALGGWRDRCARDEHRRTRRRFDRSLASPAAGTSGRSPHRRYRSNRSSPHRDLERTTSARALSATMCGSAGSGCQDALPLGRFHSDRDSPTIRSQSGPRPDKLIRSSDALCIRRPDATQGTSDFAVAIRSFDLAEFVSFCVRWLLANRICGVCRVSRFCNRSGRCRVRSHDVGKRSQSTTTSGNSCCSRRSLGTTDRRPG